MGPNSSGFIDIQTLAFLLISSILTSLFASIGFIIPDEVPTLAHDEYMVSRVIDGDTVALEKDGEEIKVRLIGIDTPETVHPSKPVECFGREASEKAKALLDGEVVTLVSDPTQGAVDRYSRHLGYIFLSDGTHVNQKMIEDGYAYEYTYRNAYTYQDAFKEAEDKAREAKRGLWAEGVCEG
jgi:micrococcal nuclease